MTASINLYQPLHPKTTGFLSSSNIVTLYGVFCLFLLAIYGYRSLENSHLSRDLADAEQRRIQAEQALKKVQQEHQDSGMLALTKEIELISHNLELKRQAMRLLTDKTLVNLGGFSLQLMAIAKQSRDGLWLEKIRFFQGGEQLELTGKAKQPEFLFQYLQRLGGESPLKGKAFNAFSLTKPPGSGDVLRFFLGTAGEEKGEEKETETENAKTDGKQVVNALELMRQNNIEVIRVLPETTKQEASRESTQK